MSSFCKCKSYSHFFQQNIRVDAIFDDQSFNDILTNDIVSFEQLGPGYQLIICTHPYLNQGMGSTLLYIQKVDYHAKYSNEYVITEVIASVVDTIFYFKSYYSCNNFSYHIFITIFGMIIYLLYIQ